MTNVLIGIIGVILFIALAVISVVFLGPRLQQLQHQNRAMAITQMASQVGAATALYRSENGGQAVAARTQLVELKTSGYLTAVPFNPFVGDGGWPFRVLYASDVESSAWPANLVFVSLGSDGEAKDVCAAINKQARGSEEIDILPNEAGTDISGVTGGSTGCFEANAAGIPGEASGLDYIAYSKL